MQRLEGRHVVYCYKEGGEEKLKPCYISFFDKNYGIHLNCLDSDELVLQFAYTDESGKAINVICSNNITIITNFRKELARYRQMAIQGFIKDCDSDGVETVVSYAV